MRLYSDDKRANIERSLSLPRTLDDNDIAQEKGAEPHPGHRYFTPQPGRKKPHLPPKPGTPVPDRRSDIAVSSRVSGVIAVETDNDTKLPEAGTPGEEKAGFNQASESFLHGRTPAGTAEQSLSASRLAVLRQTNTVKPLAVRARKSPIMPPKRRKSDTHLHVNKELKKRNEALNPEDTSSLKRDSGNKILRSASSAGQRSASPGVGHFGAKRPAFLTPQPIRRKLNLIDRTPSFNESPPVGPVERLALKIKRSASHDSLDSVLSAGSSSSPSPRTPMSLLSVPSLKTSKVAENKAAIPGHKPTDDETESGKTRRSDSERVEKTTEPFVPKRRAPITPPLGNRRKSDSHLHVTEQLKRGNEFVNPQNTSSLKHGSGNKVQRSASSAGHRSASPDVGQFTAKRPQFLTPQPTRRKFNLADRTPSFNESPPVGPVERLALKIKRSASHDSLDSALSAGSSPSLSPHTPVSPQALSEMGTKNLASQKTSHDAPDSGHASPDQSSPRSPNIPAIHLTTPSPSRQRPKLRRGRGSRTSLGSLALSMLANKELLNDIFLSDRKSHRKLKGVIGALAGLVLGGCLFLGVHYGLQYDLITSIVITVVGTLVMCLSLAFTVRARCVAALMVPTLCTTRGRAAFLALIVTLLLTGPIDNMYTNAKVASDSMSCSAELAQNQTKLIRDAAREIFDVYVRNLQNSVRKLQEAADAVHDAFRPIEDALGGLADALENAGQAISAVADACKEIIQGAYTDCTRGVNDAYDDCKVLLKDVPDLGSARVDEICELINIGNEVCKLLSSSDDVCRAPTLLDDLLNQALRATEAALDDLRRIFDTNVDFTAYWENRYNQSQSFDSIQAAIQQELQDSVSFLNSAFSIVDKILALSVVFLLFRSYQYHSKYRTKDRFDNIYVTKEFKLLDEKRRKSGKDPLLPLKKSERRRLINLSSVWLSKPEKGLFRLGLATVFFHSTIAALLILADYGLFWLLALIARHGKFTFEISGGGGTDLTIGGTGVLSQLIQSLFVEGFAAASQFNITLNTEHCLPQPVPPNVTLSVGIGVLYLIAVLTVISQAYALRLRRRIASYFYPERELERIYFLYNSTLQRRQNLFKLLKQRIRQARHEMDVEKRVSFVAYLSARYPCWRRIFRFLGQEKRVCLGCADVDDGTFKSCGKPDCRGLYCRECLHEIGNTCTLCQEIVTGSEPSIGVVEHIV